MKIGRLYSFEAAHVVRDCASKRCKYSIHGHSYTAEIALSAKGLDKAGMIYDFGLMKREIGSIIDCFDHSTILFTGDDDSYKNMIKTHSARWIELPFNTSAEQIARVLFALISKALSLTTMQNSENGVFLEYVKLNETAKGWACFEKADFESLGVDIASITCSQAVSSESGDIISRLSKNEKFTNPKEL